MQIEKNTILSLLHKEVNFALFKDPALETVSLFIDINKEATEKFIFQSFDKNTPSIVLGNNLNEILEEFGGLQEYLTTLPNRVFKTLSNTGATSLEQYQKHFIETQEKLESGELKKMVLSRIIEKEISNLTKVVAAFYRLIEIHPKSLVYIFGHRDSGFWLGATPEKLMVGQGNKYHCHSLAGTKLRNESNSWTDKELEEQKFVTDYLLEELKSAGATDIQLEKQETVHFQNISHLRNVIRFTANDSAIVDILHPTPAVAGTPKKRAIECINEIESHNRHYYTGYLGLITNNFTSLYVNLRCMHFNERIAKIYVGGGITKKSKLEEERKETENKAQTLLSLL